MNESTPTLADRVEQFMLMELPGQPRMMHMGTSYLVNDLWRAHREMLQTLRDIAGGLPGERAAHRFSAVRELARAAIAKAEGRAP